MVAFIDDDALASETWLMALTETFTSVEQADAVGGLIEPIRPTEIPSWVPRRLHSHLSIVNYGTKLIPLKYPHYPFGTNMAFRRAVFEKVGLFDPSFGRKGMTSFLTGEETDLFLRIERAG